MKTITIDKRSLYQHWLKRPLDVVLALMAIALLWPLMLLVAASVLLLLGRPILYVHRRAGLAGAAFDCLKFRTMTLDVDASGTPLPDEERLTLFGRFLRVASLDELPQLWNVVKGEMSLVGPRPLTIDYLDLYTPQQARRHEVRPGITGWAQVNGRNELSWTQKFELDAWYVDRVSFLLDVKILLLTVGCVLRPRGISGEGSATMNAFLGSDST